MVVNVRGSTILTVAVAVAAALDAAVAVRVTDCAAVRLAGAEYVTEELVLLVRVPQPAPEQPLLWDMLQVTPWLWISLATVAVKVKDCPESSDTAVFGRICTVIPAELLLHPASSSGAPQIRKRAARRFRSLIQPPKPWWRILLAVADFTLVWA